MCSLDSATLEDDLQFYRTTQTDLANKCTCRRGGEIRPAACDGNSGAVSMGAETSKP